MGSFDLASIIGDAAAGAQTFGALATQTLQNTKAQTDITDIMASAARDAQSAAVSLEEGNQTIRQATQQTNLKIARTLGTDANDSGYLIKAQGDRIIKMDKERQALYEDIQAKKSVSFLDNPLGYLWAQATVDDDISQYNLRIRESDNARDTATKLESMSQAAFQTQNAIEQSVTDASIKQSAVLKGYAYGQAANEAQLAGLRTNLAGMTAAASATAQAIDLKFKGFGAVMQQKNYELNLEQLNLSKERLAAEMEAKKGAADIDGLATQFISQGYFNMSGKTLEPARQKEMLALYKGKQPEIVALFNSGMQSRMLDPSGKQTVISTSPFDAATYIGSGMVQNLPPAQEEVGKWLVQKRQEFASPGIQTRLGIDPKDKTAQERAFNQWIGEQGKIAGATGQGVYAPASLSTVAKTNPNMAALPVWNKVLAPMAAAGVDLSSPDQIFGAINHAILAKDISYNDAVSISTLYGAAVDTNNAARNWISTGLPIGTGYIIPGKYGQVNLTSKDEVSRYLNKMLVQANRPGFSGGNFGIVN